MDWLCWYTNWLLGKDSSKFVSTIHKISIFPSIILSKSPTLFLMELIFRYEKITLLRLQCRKRVKVRLIFSSYSWLVIDASIRGLIYLLTCSTCLVLGHTLLKTLTIFCAKILMFRKSPPKNIFFVESSIMNMPPLNTQ